MRPSSDLAAISPLPPAGPAGGVCGLWVSTLLLALRFQCPWCRKNSRNLLRSLGHPGREPAQHLA